MSFIEKAKDNLLNARNVVELVEIKEHECDRCGYCRGGRGTCDHCPFYAMFLGQKRNFEMLFEIEERRASKRDIVKA